MKKVIIIFSLMVSLLTMSQNMVFNPSFEKANRCALDFGEFNERVFHWSTPTNGTTDLFNRCSFDNVGVPINFHGRQVSVDGGNYAGCYFLAPKNYREYIQGELKSTLKSRKKYRISFYINLSDNSVYAIKNIGILFSSKQLSLPTKDVINIDEIDQENQVIIYPIDTNTFYDNKDKWVLVTTEIIARGNENYITIGNFIDNHQTEKVKLIDKNFYMSYYYIDFITVEPLDIESRSNLINKKEKNSELQIELGKTHIFQNVIFGFNSIELNEKSKKEIDIVYNFLKENYDTHITITGHTDNIGSEQFNVRLSENRIKSVVDYLLKKGLDKQRVAFKGYGAKRPIFSNDTEEGKRKNRRVEFKITRR